MSFVPLTVRARRARGDTRLDAIVTSAGGTVAFTSGTQYTEEDRQVRVLVGLNHLEIGGAQLNALDLAVAVRARGHDVSLFADYTGTPGPVAQLARDAGFDIDLVEYRGRTDRPSLARWHVAQALRRVVERRGVDLVHAYEIQLIMDSFFGPHLMSGTPLAWTIYSMSTSWWMPRYPPLIVGADSIADAAAGWRGERPVVLEVPVDTDANHPSRVDGSTFRHEHGLGDDLVVGIVSRLEPSMKAEGIELTIAAMRHIPDNRLRLAITGDGPSRQSIQRAADQVNAELGRPAVVLTGPLVDPRPAYAAADIVLGMGGSSLRAMAFSKPVIILGANGFALPCRPDTVDEFLTNGFYGVGSGERDPETLAQWIHELGKDPDSRAQLGAFGRQLVIDRFSLSSAAVTLEALYLDAIQRRHPLSARAKEAARCVLAKAGSEHIPEGLKAKVRHRGTGRLVGYRAVS
jgi:glycosyltransferase involved in cell wall biosynthesis